MSYNVADWLTDTGVFVPEWMQEVGVRPPRPICSYNHAHHWGKDDETNQCKGRRCSLVTSNLTLNQMMSMGATLTTKHGIAAEEMHDAMTAMLQFLRDIGVRPLAKWENHEDIAGIAACCQRAQAVLPDRINSAGDFISYVCNETLMQGASEHWEESMVPLLTLIGNVEDYSSLGFSLATKYVMENILDGRTILEKYGHAEAVGNIDCAIMNSNAEIVGTVLSSCTPDLARRRQSPRRNGCDDLCIRILGAILGAGEHGGDWELRDFITPTAMNTCARILAFTPSTELLLLAMDMLEACGGEHQYRAIMDSRRYLDLGAQNDPDRIMSSIVWGRNPSDPSSRAYMDALKALHEELWRGEYGGENLLGIAL